jgi:hypothetical protein
MLRHLGYDSPTDWSFQNDQDNGERPSLPPTTKPVIVRSIMDTTDLIGWLFLKDQGNGERRHCVAECDYSRDEHSMLGKIVGAYKLDAKGMEVFQSLIGFLQLAVSLGRMDIATVVMAMSSFWAIPRQGHLESVKHIDAYISTKRHGATRLHADAKGFSPFGISYHNWMGTVFGDCKDDVLTAAPMATDRLVHKVHYVDEKCMHDMISSELVTGCTHLIKQMSEMAIDGSVCVAAKHCTEQIHGIRTLPQHAAVPLRDQEPIAANMAIVVHSNRWIIPAGTLKKQLGNKQVWNDRQLLSWPDDTMSTVVNRNKDKDEIMDSAEVAKKNKIEETANHTTSQMKKKMKIDRSRVEKGKLAVDETMEDEEVKLGNEVEKEKRLKYAKKVSIHFVSKGRGVSENKEDRARVKGTSDSTNVYPFLTV